MKLIDYLSKKTDFKPKKDDVKSIFLLEDEPSSNTILALNAANSLDEKNPGFLQSQPSQPAQSSYPFGSS